MLTCFMTDAVLSETALVALRWQPLSLAFIVVIYQLTAVLFIYLSNLSLPLFNKMPVLFYDQEIQALFTGGYRVADTRIAVMFGILFLSLFAVSFPGLSKQLPYLQIPHLVFFIGKHFGTGAILSTAFCHLLPDAFRALQDPKLNRLYHGINKWIGMIVLGSLLAIFLVEYISTSYVDHLHSKSSAPPSPAFSLPASRPETPPRHTEVITISAGPSSEPEPIPCSSPNCIRAPTERTPLLYTPEPTTPRTKRSRSLGTLNDEEQRILSLVLLNAPRLSRGGSLHSKLSGWSHEEACVCNMRVMHAQAHEVGAFFENDEQEGERDHHGTIGRKRQVIGILILQLGIMIHSLVIGLTLAIASGAEFQSLVMAITFHQLFEGLSLGIRIAGLPSSPTSGRQWLSPTLFILFAIMTPLGMIAGLLLFAPMASTKAQGGESVNLQLTQGLMAAISAGMLIYASTVEMLAGDFVFGDVSGDVGHGHGHGHGHGYGHDNQQENEHEHEMSAVKKKALAVFSLLVGATAMALVGLDE